MWVVEELTFLISSNRRTYIICQRLDAYDDSYALHPFYHIRQPDLWIIILTMSGGTLYKVWAAHFYGQGIFFTQAYFDHSAWGTSTNFRQIGGMISKFEMEYLRPKMCLLKYLIFNYRIF